MPRVVELSSKEKVHINQSWTHEMERKFDEALFPEGREIQDNVSIASAYAAYDAVLPLIIEKIVKADGSESAFDPSWFGKLRLSDAKKIKDAVFEIMSSERELGKKGA